MIFNSKGKCIKIKQVEYDTIKDIYYNSTCLMVATNKTIEYLKTELKIGCDKFTASNLVCAVINNYKYMKVED